MRKVTTVQLQRAEGPIESIGRWLDFPDFESANAQLAQWAQTAPDSGGYDKCDFRVLYDRSDEDSYEGRFDLEREHTAGGRLLQEHMEAFVLWFWGLQVRDRETGELVKT